jgi:hypothetical protein
MMSNYGDLKLSYELFYVSFIIAYLCSPRLANACRTFKSVKLTFIPHSRTTLVAVSTVSENLDLLIIHEQFSKTVFTATVQHQRLIYSSAHLSAPR